MKEKENRKKRPADKDRVSYPTRFLESRISRRKSAKKKVQYKKEKIRHNFESKTPQYLLSLRLQIVLSPFLATIGNVPLQMSLKFSHLLRHLHEFLQCLGKNTDYLMKQISIECRFGETLNTSYIS